jgi:hypothetical protein
MLPLLPLLPLLPVLPLHPLLLFHLPDHHSLQHMQRSKQISTLLACYYLQVHRYRLLKPKPISSCGSIP